MKILWIDAQVGLAGDMLLAALIDAGADAAYISEGLTAVVPEEDWQVRTHTVRRGAFSAQLLSRFCEPSKTPHHHHRPWHMIRSRIAKSGLPERVTARSLAAYERLAKAEAKIHGIPIDEVELHEVGANDAIGDIVGVCLALESLNIDTVVATPLPMGTGFVQTAHGKLPLPAPATLSVLEGWPIVPSSWPGEWVTPTGATLVAALGTAGPPPSMVVGATGIGAGNRNPDFIANVVRVMVGYATAKPEATVTELAANIDDMLSEHVPPLIQRLLDEGALDAWATPIIMKKGRPALTIQALVPTVDSDRLSDTLLRHSSTLGVRRSTHTRRILDRWTTTVQTPFGSIKVKIGGRDNIQWHASPEFEDVHRAAQSHNVPLATVHQAALAGLGQSENQ